jgi:hypothetical protein
VVIRPEATSAWNERLGRARASLDEHVIKLVDRHEGPFLRMAVTG